MLVDYHIHAAAHGQFEYTRERIESFVQIAKQRGISVLGFSEHDEWAERINRDVIEQVRRAYPGMEIAIGLEVDFIPGREAEIQRLLAQPYDYAIGSIHFIEGWNFDHPTEAKEFERRDIDQVYAGYFALVIQAAQSGLFDFIGHLDLIKIWGHRPNRQAIADYLEPVLQSIHQAGIAIEINSAGLRKPIAELYPAREIIEMIYHRGIPITLSSDAHIPEQVGENLAAIAAGLKQIGFRKIVKFQQRQTITVEL